MELHVYSNDVIDWFVAESAEEARTLAIAYAKECGIDLENYEEYQASDYEREPDDRVLAVNNEGDHQEKTCAEWASKNGKGFLCSTEY